MNIRDRWIGFEDDVEQVINLRVIAGDHLNSLTEVQRTILMMHITNGDHARAKQFMRDWGYSDKVEAVWITKWNPGTHYWTEGHQFPTYEAAEKYLFDKGMKSLGLKNVPTRIAQEGD